MTVYAAYQKADRHGTSVDNTLNLGSPGYNQAISFTQTAPAADRNPLINPRTVNTGLGYSFNPTACPVRVLSIALLSCPGPARRKRRRDAAWPAT